MSSMLDLQRDHYGCTQVGQLKTMAGGIAWEGGDDLLTLEGIEAEISLTHPLTHSFILPVVVKCSL